MTWNNYMLRKRPITAGLTTYQLNLHLHRPINGGRTSYQL